MCLIQHYIKASLSAWVVDDRVNAPVPCDEAVNKQILYQIMFTSYNHSIFAILCSLKTL